MALLALKDIGKIYVSEGSIAVGIRGVNLSFDKGEFVAVTGKSGSGKSTLLNVISGMDTYEEGELLIEGNSTSHYLQPDWEDYRQRYISFIFQDYNIMESYTVLQNVELALMHIADAKERRRRALELIERVGLTKHLRHKGSKLSGGQKQRTVIARALAKDSPIILADEPTGNLDSTTSKEIIDLLREVSHDKLVIVVTHNFEQVEHCATRHIRIFDGAVESDHATGLAQAEAAEASKAPAPAKSEDKKSTPKKPSVLACGMMLGRTLFTSRPRLSIFMCLLMLVGTLGLFLITAFTGGIGDLFEESHLFREIDGRVVITAQNGEVLTDEELAELAAAYGAESYLHYDLLLDQGITLLHCNDYMYSLHYTYGEDFGDQLVGRYPTAANEVLLRLPISCQPAFGKKALLRNRITLSGLDFDVVGVSYFYDNNQQGKVLFTSEGFRTVTAAHCIFTNASYNLYLSLSDPSSGKELYNTSNVSCIPTFHMDAGKLYIEGNDYTEAIADTLKKDPAASPSTALSLRSTYYSYNYYMGNSSQSKVFSKTYTDADLTDQAPRENTDSPDVSANDEFTFGQDMMVTVAADATVYIHTDALVSLADEFLSKSYRQASLFFSDNRAAEDAAERLGQAGYIAVLSDSVYEPDPMDTVVNTILALGMLLLWFFSVLFIGFFVRLCSNRTLSAFQGDLAIMRSMGIPVKVIRVGMYARMLLCLIPAFFAVVGAAFLVYTLPALNLYFTYLYAWQYLLIFAGMLLLAYFVTRKQLRRMFGESVKKALKGGNAA